MLLGKKIRLKRILENGKMLCIPMDHGLSSGPLKGIENMDEIIQKIELGGATSTVLNKGIIKSLNHLPNLGLIMHLSGSTSLGNTPNWKVKVGDVKEAKTSVKSVKYSVLYMKAIKALQEAMARIEALEAK